MPARPSLILAFLSGCTYLGPDSLDRDGDGVIDTVDCDFSDAGGERSQVVQGYQDEDGDGFGGGVGYRHFFGEDLGGWFMGARVDLWSLEIDWRDKLGTPKKRRGSTDVLVLQPTFELGYGFLLEERVRLNVFGAAGAEINVSTHGEHVGEGAIGLLGLSLVFGF